MAPPLLSKRGESRCLALAPAPADLFNAEEPKVHVWDSFIPVWGDVVKFGQTSTFDEVTYKQMLDDLRRRNLCVYMDNDHKTAQLGWSVEEVQALAYYCAIQVNHGGAVFDLAKLAGHTCCDAVPLDPATHPEGAAGFRCRVTPYGREKLPNYQALSIQFDPRATDEKGHEVGQALVCVSATNGPHIPGAGPPAGQFSAARSATNMAKETDPAGTTDPAKMTAEMDALRTELGLPDGSSGESVIGAALAIVKAAKGGEPEGEEAMDDSEVDSAYAEADADGSMGKLETDVSKKQEDKGPEFGRKFSRALRRNVARVVSFRRGQAVLAKQLGCKPGPKSIAKAFMVHAAGQSNAEQRLARIEEERADEKADQFARQQAAEQLAAENVEIEIKTLLNAAGPKNAPIFSGKVGSRELARTGGSGVINDARGQELFETAKRLKATADDVRKWLPAPELATFTKNGSPGGNAAAGSSGAGGSDDRVLGGEQAAAIKKFRDQYKKDTGKLLIFQRAAGILQPQFSAGQIANFDYAAAKEMADRQGAESFVKGGK